MKSPLPHLIPRLRHAAAPVAAVLALLAASPASAQTPYYWDTDGIATNGTYGGNGTWDTTTANWNSGPTITNTNVLVTWPGAADNARFLRGTSGDVTVAAGGVTARTVGVGSSAGSFATGSASYTFSGGPITLALGGFATALSASFGSTAVFTNQIVLAGTNVKIENNNGGSASLTFLGGISNAATAVSELKFSGFASTGLFDVSGAITRNGANNFKLVVGDTNSVPAATVVRLSANNTGIGGSASENVVNQGTLYLNHNGALGTASGLTVANARTGGSDTNAVLIGVSGVTNSKTITFNSTSDTADSRRVGSDLTSGTATFSGGLTLGQFAASGLGSTLQITQAAGGTTIISGLVSDGANTSSITKIGAGTVILSRAAGNTYDGGTFVSAGTLLVNNTSGSGTGTGGVLVNGGKIGGTGSISGAVDLSAGTFSPGASIETLGSGTLTLGSGTTFEYEVDSSVATSVGADLAKVSGGLNLNGVVSLTLTNIAAVPVGFTDNTTFSLINYTGAWNGRLFTYGLVTLTNGAQFTFNGQDWTIDYAATNGGVNFSGEHVAGSFVNMTSVPEPSTWALLGLGAAAALLMRRRRA